LFALQSGNAFFVPDLSAAPNDFSLAFVYSYSCLDGPIGIALDAKDAIWVADSSSSNICELTPLGNDLPVTGNGISQPYGIAIDGNGYVWVTSHTNALSSFTSGRTAVTTTTAGGLSDPQDIAIDGSNNVWVESFGNALTEFSNSSGTPSTVAGDPFGTTVLNGPKGVAVDVAGNAWVANSAGTPELVRFTGSSPSTPTTFTGEGLDLPVYLAFDPSGDVWATNDRSATFASESALSKFNSTGGGLGYFDGGGLNTPIGIAIDSNGNVWAADEEGNCISESNSAGTAISPAAGYGYGSGVLNAPYHLAIDLSGNLWVTNPGTGSGNTVTEFIGIASPVVTPMAANLQSPYSANNSAVNRP
jgi:streptogramin lyase